VYTYRTENDSPRIRAKNTVSLSRLFESTSRRLEGWPMTRQSSLCDFERDTTQEIIERVQQQAREAIDSREVA